MVKFSLGLISRFLCVTDKENVTVSGTFTSEGKNKKMLFFFEKRNKKYKIRKNNCNKSGLMLE